MTEPPPKRTSTTNPGDCNDAIPPGRSVNAIIGVCYTVFFLSGAAALILELSWSRQIGLLFGHTVHAAAVVLAAYFFGLALGNTLGGSIARKVNPLKSYAVAEFIVAGWACLVPIILTGAEAVLGTTFLNSDSPTIQLILRISICMITLLPATIAMGSTLPLMAEYLLRLRPKGFPQVSRAYAFNTAGAFTGVVVATAILLVTVGVRSSGFVAAGLAAFCGMIAFVLERLVFKEPNRDLSRQDSHLLESSQASPNSRRHTRRWIIMAAVCGFGTLALEVLYLRLFSLTFHNSTYTFGIVIAVYLLALACGAWLAAAVSRFVSTEALLRYCCWAGGFLAVLSVVIFAQMTGLMYFMSGDTFFGYLAAATLQVTCIVFPPVTVLGMVLPTLWKAAAGNAASSAQTIGIMTMANTLAAAAGSLAASFLLLPACGLWNAFVVIGLIFCAMAGVLNIRQQRFQQNLLILISFTAVSVPLVIPPGGERWAVSNNEELIQRWNSSYGWVDVVRNSNDMNLRVRQNRHYRYGATGPGAVRAYRQAHLPLLLHSAPKDVAFLGLGTGLTAAGALAHEPLNSITIAELIPEVVDAARLLSTDNYGIVDHPKVRIKVDDARHFLQTTEQHFDVIVSDLFVPWESETGYLYTTEHYQQAQSRLREGGLFCQWLPLYQLGSAEFEMIANSFASVFPNTTLWWGQLKSRRAIVALVGTQDTIALDASAINQRLAELEATGLFRDSGLDNAIRLHERLGGGWTAHPGAILNTDEHPRVEFGTPASHKNHQLLQGRRLKKYFESVMAELPTGAIRFNSNGNRKPADQQRRRDWLHFILFNSAR